MKKKKKTVKEQSKENLEKLYDVYDNNFYSTHELDEALEKNSSRVKLVVNPLEIEELRNCLMQWKKIKLIVTIVEKEFLENVTKRNVSAGIRSRKGFRELKKLIHDLQMKMEILDRKKDEDRHDHNSILTEFTESMEEETKELVFIPTVSPETYIQDDLNKFNGLARNEKSKRFVKKSISSKSTTNKTETNKEI